MTRVVAEVWGSRSRCREVKRARGACGWGEVGRVSCRRHQLVENPSGLDGAKAGRILV